MCMKALLTTFLLACSSGSLLAQVETPESVFKQYSDAVYDSILAVRRSNARDLPPSQSLLNLRRRYMWALLDSAARASLRGYPQPSQNVSPTELIKQFLRAYNDSANASDVRKKGYRLPPAIVSALKPVALYRAQCQWAIVDSMAYDALARYNSGISHTTRAENRRYQPLPPTDSPSQAISSGYIEPLSYWAETKGEANLRSAPSTDAPILRKLQKNEVLFVDSVTNDAFWSVVVMRTGEEGLIHKSLLSLIKSQPHAAKRSVNRARGNAPAMLEIANKFSVPLNMRIGDSLWRVEAGGKRLVVVQSGTHWTRMTAAGGNCLVGWVTYQRGDLRTHLFYEPNHEPSELYRSSLILDPLGSGGHSILRPATEEEANYRFQPPTKK